MIGSTPGPWTCEGTRVFAPRAGGLIAETYDNAGTGSDKCALPNARLIAAAPELLEALRLVITKQGHVISSSALDLAQAVIAKAEASP